MTNPIKQFEEERRARINSFANDEAFQSLSKKWLEESMRRHYCYNFSWLGRPVIQNPSPCRYEVFYLSFQFTRL